MANITYAILLVASENPASLLAIVPTMEKDKKEAYRKLRDLLPIADAIKADFQVVPFNHNLVPVVQK